MKKILEGAMEGEIVEQIFAGRYRRTEVRQCYRNRYRSSKLLIPVGMIKHLRVPIILEG